MRIAVTGAEGMLGRAVVEEAMARGHDVLPFGRELDITHGVAVHQQLRHRYADVLINCAGVIPPAPGKERIGLTQVGLDYRMVMSNAVGPEVLADVAASLRLPFVHISTDCVFHGGRRPLASELGGYTIDEWPDARDLYGRSKMVGETGVIRAWKRGEAAIVRTSFIGFQHGLLRWLIDNDRGKVDGYAQAWWSGGTVWIVASRLIDLCEQWPADIIEEGIVHLATRDWTSKLGLLLDCSSALGLDLRVRPINQPSINHVLAPTWELPPLKEQLEELRRRWCPKCRGRGFLGGTPDGPKCDCANG